MLQPARPTTLHSNVVGEESSGRKKKLKMSKVVARQDHDLGISEAKMAKIL